MLVAFIGNAKWLYRGRFITIDRLQSTRDGIGNTIQSMKRKMKQTGLKKLVMMAEKRQYPIDFLLCLDKITPMGGYGGTTAMANYLTSHRNRPIKSPGSTRAEQLRQYLESKKDAHKKKMSSSDQIAYEVKRIFSKLSEDNLDKQLISYNQLTISDQDAVVVVETIYNTIMDCFVMANTYLSLLEDGKHANVKQALIKRTQTEFDKPTKWNASAIEISSSSVRSGRWKTATRVLLIYLYRLEWINRTQLIEYWRKTLAETLADKNNSTHLIAFCDKIQPILKLSPTEYQELIKPMYIDPSDKTVKARHRFQLMLVADKFSKPTTG